MTWKKAHGRVLRQINMVIFDTNALLRYILQDNMDMADKVEEQINKSRCFIPTEVIAEMVYVLSKVYAIPKPDITEAIIGVLSIDNVTTANNDIIVKGFEAYVSTSLDFVDCLLAGYQDEGHTIFTFDKKLWNYLQSA